MKKKQFLLLWLMFSFVNWFLDGHKLDWLDIFEEMWAGLFVALFIIGLDWIWDKIEIKVKKKKKL